MVHCRHTVGCPIVVLVLGNLTTTDRIALGTRRKTKISTTLHVRMRRECVCTSGQGLAVGNFRNCVSLGIVGHAEMNQGIAKAVLKA